ncbi:threonylcarbamoyl-AMP synthase [Candidatus Saccharibacteria bacterium]|nr:threonylcarbamoyl-AMP synthase [Candidatus Saccharibacteria bacterium]
MSYLTQKFDDKVVELLKNGGVGFIPSDTIYGLSARALDKTAVKKLQALKGRTQNKPFIILISNIWQLKDLGIKELSLELITKYWPGPLTIVFDAPKTPKWLHQGFGSLAVRLPKPKELRDLINKVGPLISTSANPDGQPPAVSSKKAEKYFGDKLDFYIDAGEIIAAPSTIVKLTGGKLEILRQGSVKINQ